MCVCAAGEDDLVDITDYLMELDKSHIYNLGLVLGLARRHVNDFKQNCDSNIEFLDAVLLHWLQRVDRVGEVSWLALVKALRHPRLGQTGIADKIASQHGKGVKSIFCLTTSSTIRMLFTRYEPLQYIIVISSIAHYKLLTAISVLSASDGETVSRKEPGHQVGTRSNLREREATLAHTSG